MNQITHETVTEIKQLDRDGLNRDQIENLVGHDDETIDQVLRGVHRLQILDFRMTHVEVIHKARDAVIAIVGERTGQRSRQRVQFLPTPQQIEAACRAIRDTWTDAERCSRYC